MEGKYLMESTAQNLSGHGAPTKNTVGNIGDTYADLDTGIEYTCITICSYTGHKSFTIEYIWKKEININSGGSSEGGTTNYNELSNLPKINGITVKGNLTLDSLGISTYIEELVLGGAS